MQTLIMEIENLKYRYLINIFLYSIPLYQTVRLVDAHGHTHAQSAGRVELYNSPEWGTVCDDDFDINGAQVVCHQLGFPAAIAEHCCAHFGEGSGSILLDNVHCVGNESSILDCETSEIGEHNCGHYEDVSVTCEQNGKSK